MSKFTIKSLLIIALAVLPLTFFGQENTNDNQKKEKTSHWFVGFDEGTTFLYGDNKDFDFKNIIPQVGFHGGYAFGKHFSAYLRFTTGTLRGSWKNHFKIENCGYFEYDINVAADLVSLILGYNPDRVIGFKPHVGIGQMHFQTRITDANGQMVRYGYSDSPSENKGDGLDGRILAWEVPFGAELEFNIYRRFSLFADFTWTYTDTDLLDGYESGDHYEWYTSLNVGFRFKFRKPKPNPCEPVPCEPVPCEIDQDAIDKAIQDGIQKYIDEHPYAPEEDEADDAESLDNFEEKDIHLTFKVGKAEVEDNEANREEVNKVKEDIDNGREVNTIMTVGYASPEGNDEQNQKLSENRAQATADFIQEKLGDQAEGITFSAKGMGSDWDGFYAALENSTIANKAEIAEQIKNSENPTATLNKMRMQNPELGKLLDSLRKTQVFINK